MKKFLIFVILAGCGPIAADVTLGWGSNQKIKKTLEMDQTQTDTQSNNQASVWEDIIKILPAFLVAQPTPTPTPPELPRVKSVTIELEPSPTPTPLPELKVTYAPRKTVRKKVNPCPK